MKIIEGDFLIFLQIFGNTMLSTFFEGRGRGELISILQVLNNITSFCLDRLRNNNYVLGEIVYNLIFPVYRSLQFCVILGKNCNSYCYQEMMKHPLLLLPTVAQVSKHILMYENRIVCGLKNLIKYLIKIIKIQSLATFVFFFYFHYCRNSLAALIFYLIFIWQGLYRKETPSIQ